MPIAATLVTLGLVLFSFWIPVATTAALEGRADPIGNGVDLKILAIGDSITYGAGSPFCPVGAAPENCNGYRKPLYQSLLSRGNKVEFVGSTRAGDFAQNQCEGHRGKRIDDIQARSLEGISARPNVVLLHAGTNDVKDNMEDFPQVQQHLQSLVSLIYERSPNAVVFLCTIIPANANSYSGTAQRMPAYNAKVRAVYDYFKDRSKKIVLVDMNSKLTTADLSDGLHPNSGGYQKMASAFLSALESTTFTISEPEEGSNPPAGSNPDKCMSEPSWYKVGMIAEGAKVAYGDGDWVQHWGAKTVLINDGHCKRPSVRFIDLDGDGIKDYACVDLTSGKTTVWKGKGTNGQLPSGWEESEVVASGRDGRMGRSVLFADINGDGRDDYIYIDPDFGTVQVWINQGKNSGGSYYWEDIGIVSSGVFQPGDAFNIQMPDLDGDGRADLCHVNPDTGAVTAWLNTGVGKVPNWHKLGVIATGQSKKENDTVLLADFTGEGRGDYMLVGDGGKVTGFINRLQATTVAPRWSKALSVAAGPSAVNRDDVHFIDMDGDGKADYVAINTQGKVTVWLNKSTGGRYQPGEGVFLCDLDGDGAMDYFWVDHEGKGWGYLNAGKGKNQWNPLGQTATTGGRDRRQIRMAVLTKSGRADYVVVDDETGAAEWWQNTGESQNYNWAYRGSAARGPKNTIESTFGWKFKGKNVRFVDLDGDGLDDYVYVHEQGAVAWFKNTGVADATHNPEWGLVHRVAAGVDVAPRDIQFGDTDGDGLIDYVTIGRVSGRATKWHNQGFAINSNGELYIKWSTPLPFAAGTGPGQTVRLADMTGDGRVDYVTINPDNGALNLWVNRCWEVDNGNPVGDDDDDDSGVGGPSHTQINVPARITKLPEVEGLIEKTLIPAKAGDVFSYEFPDDSNRFVAAILVGEAVDFPNLDCGVHDVEGEDGNVLSCQAQSMAWLYYSIYELGGSLRDDPMRRDTLETRRVTVRDEWKPEREIETDKEMDKKETDKKETDKKRCSTPRCMLERHAPLNTWVHATNGTYRGRSFSHHFANFGDLVGHRVHVGQVSNISNQLLPKRQYQHDTPVYSYTLYHPKQSQIVFLSEPLKPVKFRQWAERGDPMDSAEAISALVERSSALTDFHTFCVGLGIGAKANREMDLGLAYHSIAEDGDPSLQMVRNHTENCGRFLDKAIERNKPNGLICYSNLTDINPELAEEFDATDSRSGPLPWQNGELPEVERRDASSLDPRTATSGSAEDYELYDVRDGVTFILFRTPTYPNGDNGQSLDDAKTDGDTSAYGFEDPSNCLSGAITRNANTNTNDPGHTVVVTEHILPERQNDRNFFEYVQRPEMNLLNGEGRVVSTLPPISFDLIRDWANLPYHQWTQRNLPANFPVNSLPATGSFLSIFAEAHGSSTNANLMVNLDKDINGYKARVMNSDKKPMSEGNFRDLEAAVNILATQEALSDLRTGFAVFNYLNDAHIQDLTNRSYRLRHNAARQFDSLMFQATGINPQFEAHLEQYTTALMTRIVNNHRLYMQDRLERLADPWHEVLNHPSTTQARRDEADLAVIHIYHMYFDVENVVKFNNTKLIDTSPRP